MASAIEPTGVGVSLAARLLETARRRAWSLAMSRLGGLIAGLLMLVLSVVVIDAVGPLGAGERGVTLGALMVAFVGGLG